MEAWISIQTFHAVRLSPGARRAYTSRISGLTVPMLIPIIPQISYSHYRLPAVEQRPWQRQGVAKAT